MSRARTCRRTTEENMAGREIAKSEMIETTNAVQNEAYIAQYQ